MLTPVGHQLRAERERRGMSLREVVRATKIRRPYLEALERNEWGAFPAAVYARGYLRSYAEHVGLDSQHLLRLHEREQRLTHAARAPHAMDRGERDARAVLEQVARARGIDQRRRRRWLIRSGIVLAGAAASVALAWALLERPAPASAEGPAIAAERSPPVVAGFGDVRLARDVQTETERPDASSVPQQATGLAEPRPPSAAATPLPTSSAGRDAPPDSPEPD